MGWSNIIGIGLLGILFMTFPHTINFIGYHWTKGSLRAIEECSKGKIKKFKATIINKQKQPKKEA